MKSVVNTEEICKPTQLLPYHLRPEKKEQKETFAGHSYVFGILLGF